MVLLLVVKMPPGGFVEPMLQSKAVPLSTSSVRRPTAGISVLPGHLSAEGRHKAICQRWRGRWG